METEQNKRSISVTSGTEQTGGPGVMSALVQTGFGPPHSVLTSATVDRPACGPNDVLIRVEAAGVNTPDWAAVIGLPYIMRLQFGLRGPKTPIRGTDVAGVVESVGAEVSDFTAGDRVFGSAFRKRLADRPGTFARFTVAPADQLAHLPESVSFEQGAAVVMSGLVALAAIRDVAQLGPGRRILINGASGGIGTLAIQLAKHRGAIVTGVCSGRNAELVMSLGADEVIDYTTRSFIDEQARYDLVLDNVLNHPPKAVSRVLTDDGMLISNSIGDVDRRLLAGIPRMARAALLRLRGVRVGLVPFEVASADLTELADLIVSNRLAVPIDSTHPLGSGADAVERMRTRRARGNLVIVP